MRLNGRVGRRGFVFGSAAVAAGALTANRWAFAQDAGDVFTIAQPDDIQPENIMPTRLNNAAWVRNVFETLVYIDPKSFEPKPVIATDWALSDDGLTMDMTLRDDVTFHTGRKMTPDDIKFSIATAADKATAAQLGSVAQAISSIDASSDTKITFQFKRPLANFFELLDRTAIVDKQTYGQRTDGSKLIGTGPYQFASWNPGASATLERFGGYRDPKAASVKSIELIVLSDPTATISALRSGRAQMAIGMQPRDTIEFDRNPMFKIVNAGGSIYPFGVNVEAKPFDNKTLRQALGYAVDRKRINDQVFNGTGTPTDLFWMPGSPGYSDVLANQYTYEPDKARQMIADAGAKGASFQISVHALPTQRSIVEIVNNNLEQVGLKPQANVLEVLTFGKRQIAGDLGPAFIQLHGMVGLSAATLLDAAPAIRKGNPSHFWTDEYMSLRKAVQEAHDNKQSATAIEALSKYMNDQAFNLALLQAPALDVVTSDVSGYFFGLDGYVWLGGAERN